MPQADILFSISGGAALVIMVWEGVKSTLRSYKERNSTWISFNTLEAAEVAAKRVDRYFGDSGKHAQCRLVWTGDGTPRVQVQVPKVMLKDIGFDAALYKFRTDVEEAVTK